MKTGRRIVLYSSLVLLSALGLRARADFVDENTPVPPVGAEGGPSRVLTPEELEQWKRGRIVFDRDWQQSQGLGTPDLNGDSCRGCHIDPTIGGAGGLDVNVFRFGRDEGGTQPFMDLPGGQAGSKLRRPDTPGRENAHPDADVFEQRQTPTLFGAGMLDSITDAAILANEDPTDADGDGIRGVARLIDVNGSLEVGKFGWKAPLPTLADFIFDAMGNELGVTVADNGRGIGVFTDADGVPDPELDAADFADMHFYLSHLASPPRAGSKSPQIGIGEQIFSDIGCAKCHIPSLEGTDGPVPLYSDLLLHNVLPADFRGMAEPGADVGFYRTAPLWGLRRTAPYFHDGRAETIRDAILVHTGEAEQVMQQYDALGDSEKDALDAFLSDL